MENIIDNLNIPNAAYVLRATTGITGKRPIVISYNEMCTTNALVLRLLRAYSTILVHIDDADDIDIDEETCGDIAMVRRTIQNILVTTMNTTIVPTTDPYYDNVLVTDNGTIIPVSNTERRGLEEKIAEYAEKISKLNIVDTYIAITDLAINIFGNGVIRAGRDMTVVKSKIQAPISKHMAINCLEKNTIILDATSFRKVCCMFIDSTADKSTVLTAIVDKLVDHDGRKSASVTLDDIEYDCWVIPSGIYLLAPTDSSKSTESETTPVEPARRTRTFRKIDLPTPDCKAGVTPTVTAPLSALLIHPIKENDHMNKPTDTNNETVTEKMLKSKHVGKCEVPNEDDIRTALNRGYCIGDRIYVIDVRDNSHVLLSDMIDTCTVREVMDFEAEHTLMGSHEQVNTFYSNRPICKQDNENSVFIDNKIINPAYLGDAHRILTSRNVTGTYVAFTCELSVLGLEHDLSTSTIVKKKEEESLYMLSDLDIATLENNIEEGLSAVIPSLVASGSSTLVVPDKAFTGMFGLYDELKPLGIQIAVMSTDQESDHISVRYL